MDNNWIPNVITFLFVAIAATTTHAAEKPNIVVIFCDDLGYGDIGAFGHPTIRTPELDRMAAEGQKWTSFYAAASVCTPSRAGLLTGRLPVRSGMCSDKRRVLFPDSTGGIPESEILIAEALKAQGYATAAVGKWHLGHLPEFLPTRNGFDSYFGIPYSNDMDLAPGAKYLEAMASPKIEYFQVPLLRKEEEIERPADQATITRRFTEEATKFIREHKDGPFFLYLAHSMPHVPLFSSDDFVDHSRRGLYGDVIEEIDWSVGQVLQTLRDEGLAKNTLVVFTSDNGPWLTFKQQGGSAGLLRGGKGGTFEGGMRVPTVFWWPGTVAPGVVADMGSTLDLFATACALSGAKMPADRIMDSYDLSPVLRGEGPSARKDMFFYRGAQVFAVRRGPFKAHFQTQGEYGGPKLQIHETPLLYHLDHDPSEQYDVAADHPEAIEEIRALLAAHNDALVRGEDQLAGRTAK